MKQNKKGFTLIELLAVIVILAIIALIATPIILSMINNARKSAAKSSTLGYVESIENYVGFYEAKAGGIEDINGYTVAPPTGACTKNSAGKWTDDKSVTSETADGPCATFYKDVDTTTKGKAPDSASVTITNGKVAKDSTFTFGSYTYTYTGSDATLNS